MGQRRVASPVTATTDLLAAGAVARSRINSRPPKDPAMNEGVSHAVTIFGVTKTAKY
jgi:hypothetical protein